MKAQRCLSSASLRRGQIEVKGDAGQAVWEVTTPPHA